MDNSDPTYFNIESLTIRFLEGSITAEEAERLKELLESSSKNAQDFQAIRETWLKTSIATGEKRYNTEQAWKIVDKASGRKSTRFFRRFGRYAAILVIAVGSGIWAIQQSGTREQGKAPAATIATNHASRKAILVLENNTSIDLNSEMDTLLQKLSIQKQGNTLDYNTGQTEGEATGHNRLVTARGGEYSVILSDGTKISLNAESELSYPTRFSGNSREIYLTGEAYLEVAKDPEHPFIVNSSRGKIQVLGTEFNISCYEGESMVTTLVNGSVCIQDKQNHKVKIRPGEQGIITPGGIEVREVDTDLYTTWKDGIFLYRDQRLDDILKSLSRWYDFEYTYQTPELANELFSAKLERFDNIDTILQLLEEVGKVKFKKEGQMVIVSK